MTARPRLQPPYQGCFDQDTERGTSCIHGVPQCDCAWELDDARSLLARLVERLSHATAAGVENWPEYIEARRVLKK